MTLVEIPTPNLSNRQTLINPETVLRIIPAAYGSSIITSDGGLTRCSLSPYDAAALLGLTVRPLT